MKTLSTNDLTFDKEANKFSALASLLITKGLVNYDETGFIPFEHLNREFLIVNPTTNKRFVFTYSHQETSRAGICYYYKGPEQLSGLSLQIFKSLKLRTTKDIYVLISAMKNAPEGIEVKSGWMHESGKDYMIYEVYQNNKPVTDPYELTDLYNELHHSHLEKASL